MANIKYMMDNLFRVFNLIQCNLVNINLKIDNTDQIESCLNLDLIDGMMADLLVMPDWLVGSLAILILKQFLSFLDWAVLVTPALAAGSAASVSTWKTKIKILTNLEFLPHQDPRPIILKLIENA